jgi:hypothetical protein
MMRTVPAEDAAVFQFWVMAERAIQMERPMKISGVIG